MLPGFSLTIKIAKISKHTVTNDASVPSVEAETQAQIEEGANCPTSLK